MSKSITYLILLALLISCSGEKWDKNRVTQLLEKYKSQPETEILLADMDVLDGGYSYYHKYNVVGKDANGDFKLLETVSDKKVTEGFYALHEQDLGMSIGRITKDGKKSTMVSPGGFESVLGNKQYGSFKEENGQRVWHFYPRYSHYSLLYFWGPRRIFHNDYLYYNNNYRYNRHYYGHTKTGMTSKWGTKSTGTKKTHSTYHSRAKYRASTWKRNYTNSSSSRGGGGWGK